MKSMKKLVLVGLVLLASVMVLAGCKMEAEAQHAHTFCEWEVKEIATEARQVIKVCTECGYTQEVVDFVYIPAGEFQMGSTRGDADNKTVHGVKISKGFFMGKYEVTQEEYSYIMGSNPSYFRSGAEEGESQERRPVENVSWYDAVVYCNKRSLAEGLTPCYTIKNSTDPEDWETVPTSSDSSWNEVICDFEVNGYRLPTEAEWEYAARAGNSTTNALIWSGTDKKEELGTYAWDSSNSDNKTHEVGMKDPNKYGLCDMSGNVREWCWDWYADDYYSQTESGSDPKGASSGDYRVNRGGSCGHDSDSCAVSDRNRGSPYYINGSLGFRVVRASSK